MLPMQLPRMSGSFIPRKSVAISAGHGWPVESRKFATPAGRTYFSSTTPAPHISGMKRKSALRCSTPFFSFCGAKFQFQKVTLLKLLLNLRASMSRWVSGVVCPFCVMPGRSPRRPQPHMGSSAARATFAWRLAVRPFSGEPVLERPRPWNTKRAMGVAAKTAMSMAVPAYRQRALPGPFEASPLCWHPARRASVSLPSSSFSCRGGVGGSAANIASRQRRAAGRWSKL
mmetsp:Transcript_25846/g.71100  ORF Transcript_25846/g.71100 Transcript_25846/m.71100 type:complete len:229 (+) Transcript_25846:1156-1842(+)